MDAHTKLRTVVERKWFGQYCGESDKYDTIKMLNMIELFVPYYPMKRKHIKELVDGSLSEHAETLFEKTKYSSPIGPTMLRWDGNVLDFLAKQVCGMRWGNCRNC